MKLSMMLNYAGDPRQAAAEARDLERAGLDIAWVAELYSFDAVSILGYLAAKTDRLLLGSAILPIYSRTPTLTAMTAAGIDAVSGGRFVLGLGTSGPQVIEGWHGVAFDQPIERTREIVEICRRVWKRERIETDGPVYHLPLPAEQGTGLGKPLKLINHPVRDEIPVFIASMGPRNVEMTAEIADGWLPMFFHPEKADSAWGDPLARGRQRRASSRPPLAVVAGGSLAICDDDTAERVRDGARALTALYVGGMGAKGQNYYNNVFRMYGYEAEAERIQDLYLDGHHEDAMAAVPSDFLEATSLVGDEGRVRERVEAYRAAGVTHLQVAPAGPAPARMVEKVKTWLS